MHNEYEINPRRSRKNQRGERQESPPPGGGRQAFASGQQRGGAAALRLLFCHCPASGFGQKSASVSRCVRRPRPPLCADLARLRSLDHLRTHLPYASSPAIAKFVGSAPPPRLTASLCYSLPPLCPAAGLHLSTRCIHL